MLSKVKTLYKPFRYKGKGKFKFSVYVKNKKTGKPKLIHFGYKPMKDFTQHKDPKRRKNYCARSGGITKKDGSKALGKDSANYWSRKILWNC